MNAVIARITLRGMLGRRRALIVLALAVPLLVLAAAFQLLGEHSPGVAAQVLRSYGMVTLLPLVALIAGTGVLGPEIEDGTIVCLLSKPIARSRVIVTKFVVAAGITIVFAAIPVLAAALILTGEGRFAAAWFAGAAAASVAYAAIFVLLTLLTRHAVIAGLVYALVWENLVGQFVPGARVVSIQEWATSITDWIARSPAVHADISVVAGLPLLAAVTVGAVWLASDRLRSLPVTSAD